MLSLAVVTAVALVTTGLRTQDSCSTALRDLAARMRWSPATPTAGTVFRVRVQAPATMANMDLRGVGVQVAGEPLHWRADSAGMSALAAVPIDSISGVALTLTCGATSDAPFTHVLRVATQPGAYRMERLRVAPQFAAAPDSALAARMRNEAAAAAMVSRAAHETPQLWTAPFLTPRASRVTSIFGGGRTFNGAVTSRHMGTDYAGAVGAPVRAANRGVVRLVGAFYLGGNVVYVDHGAGLVTAYLHLSRQLVAVGDTVARGAIIGRVGATGRVTGPHLHFITRFGQVTVDPASVYRIR